jgi:NADP-dependent 3-hydroxy acid dehydrogenase YdfG
MKAAVTGAAIADVLASGGVQMIRIDRPEQAGPLRELAARIGGTAVPMDITQVMTTIGTLNELGPLDVFVHNAGITRDRTIADETDRCAPRGRASGRRRRRGSRTTGEVPRGVRVP